MKALHTIMLGTKLSVSLFHAMRLYAVVFSKMFRKNENIEFDSSCFVTTESDGVATTVQSPFTWSCMGMLDKSLLLFTLFASIGVTICFVLVCFGGFEAFKIFNQSHYSGRIGNISGMRVTGHGQEHVATNRLATTMRPNMMAKKGLNSGPNAYDANRATELAAIVPLTKK